MNRTMVSGLSHLTPEGHKNCMNVHKELQQVSIIQEVNEQQIPKTFTYDAVYDTEV